MDHVKKEINVIKEQDIQMEFQESEKSYTRKRIEYVTRLYS